MGIERDALAQGVDRSFEMTELMMQITNAKITEEELRVAGTEPD